MTMTLDSSIKAFQSSLTQIGVTKGIENIDGWMETLEQAEFSGAKSICENLGKLKQQLESDDLDGAAIGKLMNTLADETTRTASHADASQGEKLTQFGQMLSKSSSSLSK
jgi:galactokinase